MWKILVLLTALRILNTVQSVTDINQVTVGLNITTSDCTPQDFAKDGNCTLACSVFTSSDYYFIKFTFIYYSTDPSINVTLFDARFHDGVNYNYTTSLTLNTYYSGYYRCQFQFGDSVNEEVSTQTATFSIGNTLGVNLHSTCTSSSDCVTLNAECDSSGSDDNATCNCNDNFEINYNHLNDSPACLKAASLHERCNVDAQCHSQSDDHAIYCVDNICKAIEYRKIVLAEDDVLLKIIDKLNGIQITVLIISLVFILVLATTVIVIYLIRTDNFISLIRVVKDQDLKAQQVNASRNEIEMAYTSQVVQYQIDQRTVLRNHYHNLNPSKTTSIEDI